MLGPSSWAYQGCAGDGGRQKEPALAGMAGVCGEDGCATPVPQELLLRPEPAAPSPDGQRYPPKPLPGDVPKEPLYFLQPLPARNISWEGQWSQRSKVPCGIPVRWGQGAELPAAPEGNHTSWDWEQTPEAGAGQLQPPLPFRSWLLLMD